MDEIGKSALIAIVGLMSSAVMVAGGVVLQPPDQAPVQVALPMAPPAKTAPPLQVALPGAPPQAVRPVARPTKPEAPLQAALPTPLPEKPRVPLAAFARGPEQPALAFGLPTAPAGVGASVPAGGVEAAGIARAPRVAEARLPSLDGSARPPSPDGKPPPPLSSFRRGPEQPVLSLAVPAPPPDPSAPAQATPATQPALGSLGAAAVAGEVKLAALTPPERRVNGSDGHRAKPMADGSLPPWRRYAALSPVVDEGKPMIAIIIDDLGLNHRRFARAIALPHPLTLAILPYAENIEPWAEKARAAGHELMLHLPMEPNDPDEDPGPNALLAELPAAENARRIEWSLGRFEGYVGVNNHMGSRFTASEALMRPLIDRLAERGLLFVDSLTTSASVGRELAQAQGVPTAARDIFLDNDIDADLIRRQIAKVERCAIRKGYCIAIGHPYPETLGVLEAWLPGLTARGFVLVPVSAIVARRMTG